jgi:hypothetical protein
VRFCLAGLDPSLIAVYGSLAALCLTMAVAVLWVTIRVLRYLRFQREQELRAQAMMSDEDFLAYIETLRKQRTPADQQLSGDQGQGGG